MTASKLNIALGDIMTRQPHSLSPMDLVSRADRICTDYHIHHLPVVNIYGKVVGILSRSDLLKISHGLSLFGNRDSGQLNEALFASVLVRDVMTRSVQILHSDDTIADALVLFEENSFHAIPIIEQDLLVGIVTPLDLLRVSFPKLVDN